jgi:hypothetical protein
MSKTILRREDGLLDSHLDIFRQEWQAFLRRRRIVGDNVALREFLAIIKDRIFDELPSAERDYFFEEAIEDDWTNTPW